jgi:hypothetical protein
MSPLNLVLDAIKVSQSFNKSTKFQQVSLEQTYLEYVHFEGQNYLMGTWAIRPVFMSRLHKNASARAFQCAPVSRVTDNYG